jgi:hypothetical protein
MDAYDSLNIVPSERKKLQRKLTIPDAPSQTEEVMEFLSSSKCHLLLHKQKHKKSNPEGKEENPRFKFPLPKFLEKKAETTSTDLTSSKAPTQQDPEPLTTSRSSKASQPTQFSSKPCSSGSANTLLPSPSSSSHTPTCASSASEALPQGTGIH